jgi:hypothetical protein
VDLYFYSKRKDLAATSLADLQLLIAALDDESDPDNAATIARVTGKVESFVQSDSGEPLNLYFYDDASTVASFVSDAGTTLTTALGYRDPLTTQQFESTSSSTINAGPPAYRSVTLALNSSELSDALYRNERRQFYLHVRKTTSSVTETVALLPVCVKAGVITTSFL